MCVCVCVRTRVHCLMCKNIEKSIIYIYCLIRFHLQIADNIVCLILHCAYIIGVSGLFLAVSNGLKRAHYQLILANSFTSLGPICCNHLLYH